MIRFYVASAFGDMIRTRRMIAALREVRNWHCTFDWTHCRQSDYTDSDRRGYVRDAALWDLNGAMTADVLVFLQSVACRSSYVECGGALAMGKRVWCVPQPEPQEFPVLLCNPLVRLFDSDEMVVLEAVRGSGRLPQEDGSWQ